VEEIRFERGQSKPKDIESVAHRVQAELGDENSETYKQALAAGLTTEDIQALKTAEVSVQEEKAGVVFVLVPILVAVGGGVATHIANKFWDDLVWPRIKKDLGGIALGKKLTVGKKK
jgi:hypothetical protein